MLSTVNERIRTHDTDAGDTSSGHFTNGLLAHQQGGARGVTKLYSGLTAEGGMTGKKRGDNSLHFHASFCYVSVLTHGGSELHTYANQDLPLPWLWSKQLLTPCLGQPLQSRLPAGGRLLCCTSLSAQLSEVIVWTGIQWVYNRVISYCAAY